MDLQHKDQIIQTVQQTYGYPTGLETVGLGTSTIGQRYLVSLVSRNTLFLMTTESSNKNPPSADSSGSILLRCSYYSQVCSIRKKYFLDPSRVHYYSVKEKYPILVDILSSLFKHRWSFFFSSVSLSFLFNTFTFNVFS
jgi:hypothetical protein